MAKTIKIIDGKAKTTIRLPEALYWKIQEAKTERRVSSDEAIYVMLLTAGLSIPANADSTCGGTVVHERDVSKKLTAKSNVPGVPSDFAAIHTKLDFILELVQAHGEVGSDRSWKDFDRRMASLKAATESLERLAGKPRRPGKAI